MKISTTIYDSFIKNYLQKENQSHEKLHIKKLSLKITSTALFLSQ